MRLRAGAAALATALVAAGALAACDPTPHSSDSCPEPGGEAGSSEPLLILGAHGDSWSAGAEGPVLVLYADTHVVQQAEPGAGAAGSFRAPGYYGPVPGRFQEGVLGCEVFLELTDAADDLLGQERDFGSPGVEDAGTYVMSSRSSPDQPWVDNSAYAFTDGGDPQEYPYLGRGERRSRETLQRMLTALQDETDWGQVLPVERMLISRHWQEQEPPDGWPFGSAQQVLGGRECQIIDGDEAQEWAQILEEEGFTSQDIPVLARTLPPAWSPC